MGRRRRLAVVVYVPEPQRHEVDVLRRAFGDASLHRIAPHITLVPPVNVDPDDVPEAIAAIEAAALPDAPYAITLGPPATFAPVTPVLYLTVGGDDARDLLGGQRARAFVAPLARPVGRSFVPHVTLGRAKGEPHRIQAGLTAFASYETVFLAEGITLVELLQADNGPAIWSPLYEAPFGGPRIVARGPMQVELSTTSVLPDDARDLLFRTFGPDGEVRDLPVGSPGSAPPPREPGRDPLLATTIVTARRDGVLLGVLRGRRSQWGTAYDVIDGIAVAPDHRGQGVAGHLVRRFQAGQSG